MGTLLGLDDAVISHPPREGEWSIRQVLEHLIEAERQRLARLEEALATWAKEP